jgi:hypothetical protein
MVAGCRRYSTPKRPISADEGGIGRAGPPPAKLAQLSNSSGEFCDMAQKNLPGKLYDPLKNGGNGPIKTLDVVTGPPEVGEVNTNGRA